MSQHTVADIIYTVGIHKHRYRHRNLKPVGIVQKFLPYAFPLPSIPVRDMLKAPAVTRWLKHAVFIKLKFIATVPADNMGSASIHSILAATLRTLIQYTVQPIRTEGFTDLNRIILLPSEVVEIKLLC